MDILGLLTVPNWLLVIVGLVTVVYVHCTWTHSLFRNLGIPGPKPGFFGALGLYGKKAIIHADMELMSKYGKVVGIFLGREPLLLVADADMIKQICVKQFHNFPNRNVDYFPISKNVSQSVNLVNDDHWKFQRSILTPSFTAGKLRGLEILIQKAIETLLLNARKKLETSDTIEVKQFFGGFTMDVIATTGFGLDVDSQNNPNDQFVTNARRLMTVRFGLIFVLCLFCRQLKHFFEAINVTPQPKECTQFFIKVATAAKENRIKDGSYRKDLLQMMINAHKETPSVDNEEEANDEDDPDTKIDAGTWKKRGLTNDEILANSLIFLVAAFDTTANALTFASYLLATNPECQERLIKEIDEQLGKNKPTYDNVRKLQYLDNVLAETLRIYPPAARFNRRCEADITINGYRIPKGIDVHMCTYPIHHDPEYWSEPEKFDPDRFLPENSAGRHPYCYIPFGAGPRNCIGMRLARLEAKMALVSLLQNFRFKTCPETEIPPAIGTGASGIVRPKNPLPLKFEART